MRSLLLVAVLVACTPAPVLNPNKQTNRAGTTGVADTGAGISRPATFAIAPGDALAYRKVGDSPADHPASGALLAALR